MIKVSSHYFLQFFNIEALGRNVLHLILEKAQDITEWKDIIEIIIDKRSDLFYKQDNIDVTPETRDAERTFGIAKLIQEKQSEKKPSVIKPESETKMTKYQQPTSLLASQDFPALPQVNKRYYIYRITHSLQKMIYHSKIDQMIRTDNLH